MTAASGADPGHMDVYLSGRAGAEPDGLRRQFVPSYLCSFVVGFVFGELLDRRFRFKTAPALARLRGVEAE